MHYIRYIKNCKITHQSKKSGFELARVKRPLWYCGLVDVRINASDKDLPVTVVSKRKGPYIAN